MEWKDLFPDASADDILSEVEKNWDLDLPLPVPRFEPLCVCGNSEWHARLWLFWDRTAGGTVHHRIGHRCDMSLKCASCGQVVIWGLPLPDEWIEFWGPRLDVQIDFRTAQRIYATFQDQIDKGVLDPTGWRG
jgi:hypothetical protein